MKEFWKKHIIIFCAVLCIIVLLSNLILGLLQRNFATSVISYYLIEAGFKTVIIVLLVILMARWKLFCKSKEKKILWGCLIGALNLLFILENLLPLILADPDYIQVHGLSENYYFTEVFQEQTFL
ncbi:MAG: hypothetical protein ACI4DO_02565 [Roseburia sp.]